MRVTRSRGGSGGLLAALRGMSEAFGNDVFSHMLAPATFELATHLCISGLGVPAPARGGGPNVAIANYIAGADDHGAVIALMRGVRKSDIKVRRPRRGAPLRHASACRASRDIRQD